MKLIAFVQRIRSTYDKVIQNKVLRRPMSTWSPIRLQATPESSSFRAFVFFLFKPCCASLACSNSDLFCLFPNCEDIWGRKAHVSNDASVVIFRQSLHFR